MDKLKVISRILDVGLVAIVRVDTPEKAFKVAEACLEGGVEALEVTFTMPGTARVIEELSKRFADAGLLLGAGTVLDPETARIAMLSGARFIVSPSLNPDTVRLCNRYRTAILPGCMTVRECVEAMECGVDLIKLFPGELLGPQAIKAIKAPLPQAMIVPVGGVSADNVGDWIRAGASAVAVGGSLTDGAKTGDYAKITNTAKLLVSNIKAARESVS